MPILLLAIALFCLARGLLDLRERRYGWALAGLASAAILLTTPIPSHAIKVDLPAPPADS